MQKVVIRRILKEILIKTIAIETKLAKFREKAACNFFDLDSHHNSFITGTDIKNYLNSEFVSVKDQEIYLFIAQWDWDSDGRLSKKEFANWCMCDFNGNFLNDEFLQMVICELQFLKEIEEDKYRLNKVEGFRVLDVYEMLVGEEGIIEGNQIFKILEIDEEDWVLDMAFRRISRGVDRKIGFFEFADFFLINQAYFRLGTCYPNNDVSPLELTHSIHRSYVEATGERAEIFFRTQEKCLETAEKNENLKKHQEIQLEISTLRRSLALKKDFSILKIFRFFSGKKQKISQKAFQSGLSRLGVEVSPSAFSLFSTQYPHSFSLEDFAILFNPDNKSHQSLLKFHANVQGNLLPETLSTISRLLTILISPCPNYIINYYNLRIFFTR